MQYCAFTKSRTDVKNCCYFSIWCTFDYSFYVIFRQYYIQIVYHIWHDTIFYQYKTYLINFQIPFVFIGIKFWQNQLYAYEQATIVEYATILSYDVWQEYKNTVLPLFQSNFFNNKSANIIIFKQDRAFMRQMRKQLGQKVVFKRCYQLQGCEIW